MRDLWEFHCILLDASSRKGWIKEIFCNYEFEVATSSKKEDMTEKSILILSLLFNFDSALCVLQLSGIFVLKKIFLT